MTDPSSVFFLCYMKDRPVQGDNNKKKKKKTHELCTQC